mmetsp:Transcript_14297/g.25702  ORF Transcript_14297/g.25702 Transcript_14297/m.25702 type:complete len:82 (+) Transcript_14297:264-509(+)
MWANGLPWPPPGGARDHARPWWGSSPTALQPLRVILSRGFKCQEELVLAMAGKAMGPVGQPPLRPSRLPCSTARGAGNCQQ